MSYPALICALTCSAPYRGRLALLEHLASQASISMMTQLVKGKTPAEAVVLARRFTEMLHGDEAAARDKLLGDSRVLAGVSKFAARVKCALLGWNALEEALKEKDALE